MTETQLTDTETDGPERMGEPSGDSLMGRLREKRQQVAARKTVDIPIPGYNGELVARYKLLDPLTDGKLIGDRVLRQFTDDRERVYYALVDTLIAACVGLYVRRPHDDEQLVALDPDGSGPMSYSDERIADYLGFDAETTRDRLVGVFAGNHNAVFQHGQRLQAWMGDTSSELDAGLRAR